jgi:putative endonuclease
MGELDIVAQHGDVLVIVEVRLRSHARFGGGAGSVDFVKIRRIVRTARHLLQARRELARMRARFDVVELGAPGVAPNWIRGAFDAPA